MYNLNIIQELAIAL